MVIHVDDNARLVELWLTRAEKDAAELQPSLKAIYQKYAKQRYLVAVYQSGEQELYQNTLDLLRYNKVRAAELQVRREKHPTKPTR